MRGQCPLIGDDFADRPQRQRDDTTRFLGDGNEVVWLDQAADRVPPPNQRLDAGDFLPTDMDLRLIMKEQLVAQDGVRKVARQGDPVDGLRRSGHVVNDGHAFDLRGRQGALRGFDQADIVPVQAGCRRRADDDVELLVFAIDVDRPFERRLDRRDRRGQCDPVFAVERHFDRAASDGDRGRTADPFAQRRGYLGRQRIGSRPTILSTQYREIFDVDEDHEAPLGAHVRRHRYHRGARRHAAGRFRRLEMLRRRVGHARWLRASR